MSVNKKISFSHQYGTVEGVYVNAGSHTPLIIIVNGHNGFYNYGMFPYLQEAFRKNEISSYSFNFSHGGIAGDGDYFEDLAAYEKNCMRLEVEDVLSILHNLRSGVFNQHSKIMLLAHSLGGVPLIFSATKAQEEKIPVDGIILLSTVRQLNFWPLEMVEEWKQTKVFYKKNNRTKQLLPQGAEFLEEVLQSDSKWNVQNEVRKLQQPILILHGENDEAIPVDHAHSLFEWIHNINDRSRLKIIPAATHTYNTKHPFEGTTPQVEQMIVEIVSFIQAIKIQ